MIYVCYCQLFGVGGNIANNKQKRICPNCKSTYVAENIYGDLYYRLFNGSKEVQEKERKKFAEMGLHRNPESVIGEDAKKWFCLSCGNEWGEYYVFNRIK